MNSVFLYYTALVISFFGHHFRDWLIPTFMVVTILIFIRIIFLNHILLSLVSFEIYCGSFTLFIVGHLHYIHITYRVVFLVVVGAVQAIECILWIHLFLAILLKMEICKKKTLLYSLVHSKVMSNNQKSNMSTD